MVRLFKVTIVAIALLALGGYLVYSGRSTPPRPFEVTRRAAPLIPTGTVIEHGPPTGWTHLLVKSRPRPATGDIHKIPAIARPLTRLIFTCMLARVEQRDGVHVLADYGIGIGVTIQGQDTIVSPATQAALGAELGFFKREVLTRSFAALGRNAQVARSEAMVLFDSPAVIIRDGQHQQAYYRHAVLVEPRTGRLETLIWTVLLDKEGRPAGAAGEIVCFPQNLIEEPDLHVAGSEFTLGLPSDLAFACVDLPPGKRYDLPADIQSLCGQANLTAAEAQQLETRLWQLLNDAR
ncbi:MAG: hypothetical protein AB7K24_23035 [Gemmataceae bacterium]